MVIKITLSSENISVVHHIHADAKGTVFLSVVREVSIKLNFRIYMQKITFIILSSPSLSVIVLLTVSLMYLFYRISCPTYCNKVFFLCIGGGRGRMVLFYEGVSWLGKGGPIILAPTQKASRC